MQAQLNVQLAKSRGQGSLGGTVQYPTAGALLMGQLGLSTNAPVFVPGQGPTGIGGTFYNSTPCAADHTQQMGSVSRSTDRTDPVNVYTPFQKQRPTPHASYGDHRIADPMIQMGPEECTNLAEQEVTEEGMITAAKALHKVQIKKFDPKKLNWDRWRKHFELQMHANSVPPAYWVRLLGNYLDDQSYFVYDIWMVQVTRNQKITWRDLAGLMEGQYQHKEDVMLSKMKL